MSDKLPACRLVEGLTDKVGALAMLGRWTPAVSMSAKLKSMRAAGASPPG